MDLSVVVDVFQKAQICIIAGKAIPRADKHNAPNKEMNNSSSGITAARTTGKIIILD